jgi:hypothetical protein
MIKLNDGACNFLTNTNQKQNLGVLPQTPHLPPWAQAVGIKTANHQSQSVLFARLRSILIS